MDPVSLLVGAVVGLFGFSALIGRPVPSPADMADLHRDKVYTFKTGGRFLGTAFALRTLGGVRLVTAGHVCDAGLAVQKEKGLKTQLVSDDKRTTVDVTEMRLSKVHDICVMDKLPDNTPAFNLSTSETDEPQDAIAIGFPAGRPLSATVGMTAGLSKAQMLARRALEDCDGEAFFRAEVLPGWIACVFRAEGMDSTIAVAPGSSGSPVINKSGNLIGIVSYSDTTTPGFGSLVPLTFLRSELILRKGKTPNLSE